MTTLDDCIDAAVGAGHLTKQQADSIREQRELFEARQAEDAERAAIDHAFVTLGVRQRQTALQVVKIAGLTQNVLNHPGGRARGLQAVLGRDITLAARYSNVDQRHVAVMRTFTAKIGAAMEAMRMTALGLRQDRELANRVVRELFGEASGDDKAAGFAKSIAETFEDARQRFNRAGGAIPKREDWGMPQGHDARRVSEVSREKWADFIRPLLDRNRMLDEAGVPMDDMAFEYALDQAYSTITTRGINKLVPGTPGGRKLANQHQDHRFFTFKNADAWLEYQQRFGSADPFLTMMDHLKGMAGDIALLEIMGPNPTHAYRVLRDVVRKGGEEGMPLLHADALWSVVSGAQSQAGTMKLATIDRLSAVRNVLTSMRLGSAMLSAASDMAFFTQTAAWNGLSATRAVSLFLKTLNPANAADRLRAVQMGLTAEAWSTMALHANRFAEVTGAGVSARMADFTMRASGLSAWTDAAEKAIGLEFLTRYAELADLPLADLPEKNRELLVRAGFTDRDWDVLRAAPIDEWKGVRQIHLGDLMNSEAVPRDIRDRVVNRTLEAIQELTNAAIPTPDARARAITTLGAPRGTLAGEAARFAFQFKSFPVSVIMSHVYRGIYQATPAGKGAYLGALTLGTTIMGALSLQLKEIASGREPRNTDDPKFWAAAFAQGGGAGIFGDYLYAGVLGSNRFGGSLAETAAGPAAGAVSDLVRLTAGQFGEVIEGKETNPGADLVTGLQKFTPVVGSLWYTRLAYERLVLDQLRLQVDPDARERFRRMQRRRLNEFEQRYWWRPGDETPRVAQ